MPATGDSESLARGAGRPQRSAMRLLLTLAASAIACGSTTPAPVPAAQRFDDDYEAARLAALHSKLPLAVEVWAPW